MNTATFAVTAAIVCAYATYLLYLLGCWLQRKGQERIGLALIDANRVRAADVDAAEHELPDLKDSYSPERDHCA